jgi:hypothetical protein
MHSMSSRRSSCKTLTAMRSLRTSRAAILTAGSDEAAVPASRGDVGNPFGNPVAVTGPIGM